MHTPYIAKGEFTWQTPKYLYIQPKQGGLGLLNLKDEINIAKINSHILWGIWSNDKERADTTIEDIEEITKMIKPHKLTHTAHMSALQPTIPHKHTSGMLYVMQTMQSTAHF